MRYLNIALLMCVASQGAGADEPIPAAQTGSLFRVLRATADHATLPLSFLQPEFQDLETWKTTGCQKVRELLHYDPPACDPKAEVVERADCGEYVREKVYFRTTPDRRVPAYVLLPNDPPAWRDGEKMSAEEPQP